MENRFVHFGSVLLIIAAISAGCLAGVNSMTKGVIENNKIVAANAARKEVLPTAIKFDKSLAIENEGLKFIPGVDSSEKIIGYVVVVEQSGYGGNINFSLGINLDGEITGLRITDHQETPGLGAKITGLEWENHWIGKDKAYTFNKSVDAFAGATISPSSVYAGIQKALSAYAGVNK